MEYLELAGISEIRVLFYYVIVALSAVFTLMRFGTNKLTIFIVLVFWEGLISYFCKVSNFPFVLYRIFIVIYSIILFVPHIYRTKLKTDFFVNLTFFVFSIFYWISNIINIQPFLTVASQFGFKYGLPFLFYHGAKDLFNYPTRANHIIKLLLFVVFLQVVLSFAKTTIMGFFEGVVGSISAKGAGTAVVIPVLGFFLYWITKGGVLNKKEWLIVFSLLFIAISNEKRAPVFIFPAVVLITQFYVQKSIKKISVVKYIPILLVIFYIGIKTNPTLNAEGSRWGSFDLNYAYEYAMEYNFGTEDLNKIGKNHSGRGGSLFLLFNPKGLDLKSVSEVLFGHGLADVVLQTQGKFTGANKEFDIEAENLLGKGITMVYTLGYMGLFSYLIFSFSIIRIIKNKRFRKIVLLFFIWEFFLYSGITLNANAMSFIFVIICTYPLRVIYSSRGSISNIFSLVDTKRTINI